MNDKIKALKKLIDEDAITFMKANETNYKEQYKSYLDTNNCIIGIDLAEGEDVTVSILPPIGEA